MWQFNSTSTLAFLLTSMGFYLYDSDNAGKLRVETSYGQVQGISSVSRNGKEFYEYLGIPYAVPPIGELRFAAPILPESWKGIRDATFMGPPCMQIDLLTQEVIGKEDCLYLNVFTDQVQNSKQDLPLIDLHPVLVFLHGGLFMSGGAEIYQPKYFMDEDVVVVTLNYRLASLGFLNMGHTEASGNMGLKDQVMALKWVQENIHYFGGNPNLVTIMGQGSGAASSQLHMMSDMSKGLFHQIISQSGTALAPWALVQKPMKQAQEFATKLNCLKKSQAETIDCLRELDAKIIIGAHMDSLEILHNPLAMFGPSVETVKSSDVFLSDLPIKLIKSKQFTKVPMMMGVNSEEGLVLAAPILNNATAIHQLNKNWTHWAPKLLGYDFEPKSRKDELSRRIRTFYFKESGKLTSKSLVNLTNLISDRYFFTSLHCVANAYRIENEIQGSPLFLYYYSYHSRFNLGRLILGVDGNLPVLMDPTPVSKSAFWMNTKFREGKTKFNYGTCHADELFLMFNTPFLREHTRGTQDYSFSRSLIVLWTRFARDGDPSHFQNYRWLPIRQVGDDCITPGDKSASSIVDEPSSPLQYMRIDDKSEVIDEPFFDRIKFWNSLNFPTY